MEPCSLHRTEGRPSLEKAQNQRPLPQKEKRNLEKAPRLNRRKTKNGREFQKKIFLIGFNRCATRQFHDFFDSQGIPSLHWIYKKRNVLGRERTRYLAKDVFDHRNDEVGLRRLLKPWTAFSDFTYVREGKFIEIDKIIDYIHRAFPDSYYIFNDRHVEPWIASRLRHRDGTFVERWTDVLNCSVDTVKLIWRDQFLFHRERVIERFRNHEGFVHMNIDEPSNGMTIGQQDIQPLVDMLKYDFEISGKYWGEEYTKEKNSRFERKVVEDKGR
jgi:hypothetical protein